MPALDFLIKPASGSCNMRCKYCFYADETSLRSEKNYGMMNERTLEALVRAGLEHAERECTFAFQGGEPTLTGLAFYRKFTELAERYKKPDTAVHYAIQTNGVALDEDWAEFFKANGFLVGLSVDGTREIHDANRLLADGSGSFSQVVKAARLLQKHGVDFNILTVVTGQTARHIEQIYRFFARNGYTFQQYIPCLDPLGQEGGEQVYSLSPADYGVFLKKLFDLWYNDIVNGRPIYIRSFENLVGMLLGRPPEQCGMSGCCAARQYVVEADGRVYPCDFYALDEYLLGNINRDSLEQIDQKRTAIGFVEQSLQIPTDCRQCEWMPLCRGGCRRYRDSGIGALGKNYFCEAYRDFFAYAYPRLNGLARDLARRDV